MDVCNSIAAPLQLQPNLPLAIATPLQLHCNSSKPIAFDVCNSIAAPLQLQLNLPLAIASPHCLTLQACTSDKSGIRVHIEVVVQPCALEGHKSHGPLAVHRGQCTAIVYHCTVSQIFPLERHNHTAYMPWLAAGPTSTHLARSLLPVQAKPVCTALLIPLSHVCAAMSSVLSSV